MLIQYCCDAGKVRSDKTAAGAQSFKMDKRMTKLRKKLAMNMRELEQGIEHFEVVVPQINFASVANASQFG